MALGLERLPRYFFTDQSRLVNHGLPLYLRRVCVDWDTQEERSIPNAALKGACESEHGLLHSVQSI